MYKLGHVLIRAILIGRIAGTASTGGSGEGGTVKGRGTSRAQSCWGGGGSEAHGVARTSPH